MGDVSEENKCHANTIKCFNSSIKLRLYPTDQQQNKPEQMFATNRAVYNKLVAHSTEDCAERLVVRGRANRDKKTTMSELTRKYRPISQKQTMAS